MDGGTRVTANLEEGGREGGKKKRKGEVDR